jgi:hypothetical protein
MTETKYHADPKRNCLHKMAQHEIGSQPNTKHQGSNDGEATDRDNNRFG